MKIALVVAGHIYPDVIGGAEIFAYKLAVQLSKLGNDVSIIAKKGKKFQNSKKNGLSHYAFDEISIAGIRSVSGYLQILRVLWSIKPDVSLAIMYDSALPCYLYAKFFRRKTVVALAGHDFRLISGGLQKGNDWRGKSEGVIKHLIRFGFNVIKKSLNFIVINTEMYRDLLKLGISEDHIHLIYNFIDDELFNLTGPKSNDFPSLVFCGRFVEAKRLDILIEAFKIVQKKIPNARLILVGDGAERSKVNNIVESLHLSQYVEITGYVKNSQISDYLSKASIFVSSSSFEGTPNTLLEAMAAGLPIVATKVGGIPDIITDGENGLLVQPCDVDALAEAIILLLSDKVSAKKLGSNARKKASAFEIKEVMRKYIELFDRLN